MREKKNLFLAGFIVLSFAMLTLLLAQFREREMTVIAEVERQGLNAEMKAFKARIDSEALRLRFQATKLVAQIEQSSKRGDELKGSDFDLLVTSVASAEPRIRWSVARQQSSLSRVGPVSLQKWLDQNWGSIQSGASEKFYTAKLLDNKTSSIMTFHARVRNAQTKIEEDIVVMLVREQDFFSPIFSSLPQDAISFQVVDQQGVVLAHPKKDYLGYSLANDDQIQNIITQKVGLGFLHSKGSKSQSAKAMAFEKIWDNQAILIATKRAQEAVAWPALLWAQVLISFVGFIFLGVALISYFYTEPEPRVLIREVSASEPAETEITESLTTESLPDQKLGFSGSVPAVAEALDLAAPDFEKAQPDDHERELKSLAQVTRGLVSQCKIPLISLLGQVQIAKDKEKTESALKAIEFEARQMREIIDRLNLFSLTPRFIDSPTNLREVVIAAERSVEALALKGGVSVELNIPEDIEVSISKEVLKTALTEIFTNSIESMDLSPEKSIVISANFTGEDDILVRIDDSGSGINQSVRDSIFLPFTSTKPGHKGLGLSTVYGIIHSAGGSLKVNNLPSGGTRVELLIKTYQATRIDQNNVEKAITTQASALGFLDEEQAFAEAADGHVRDEAENFVYSISRVESPSFSRTSPLDEYKIHIPPPGGKA